MRLPISIRSIWASAGRCLRLRKHGKPLFTGCVILGCCALMSNTSVEDEAEADGRLELARESMNQWVETRRILSKEKAAWAIGRELLEDRILLVEREIEDLQGRLDAARVSIAEADLKRAELIAKNEEFKQAAGSLVDAVAPLEVRTRRLAERLPEPIRDSLQRLIQRLPVESKEIEMSLSERFQNVVGILNFVDKANRNVELTSEVRTLADGTRAEVATLYIGVARAYYVSVDKTLAGIGTPAVGGWNWVSANSEASQIARAVAILKDEETAAFVRLPIEQRSRRKQ